MKTAQGFSRLKDLSAEERDRLAETLANTVNSRTRPVHGTLSDGRRVVLLPGDLTMYSEEEYMRKHPGEYHGKPHPKAPRPAETGADYSIQ